MNEIRPILPQLLDGEWFTYPYFAGYHHLYSVYLIVCFMLYSEFFKLMNEVENEDLVFTLETIVDKFGEEMAPYAIGLCQNLVICLHIFQF